MPFFSVVVPVYNKGPHIARAIRSVLDQTFDDYELILINDASTDNSMEEIKQFVDPRMRIFNRDVPGPGGYAARNLGIREANSEWVAFLDADDEWFVDHLQAYSKLVHQFPRAEMLCCGYKINNGFSCLVNPYYRDLQEKVNHILTRDIFFENFARNSFIQFTSCACVKKTLLDKIGGFPEGRATKAGDIHTWLMCALEGEEIAWSSHLGGIYYRDSANMVTRTAYPSLESILRLTWQQLSVSQEVYWEILKKIHNRRIIQENKRAALAGQKNAWIGKYLFFSCNPFMSFFWSILDLVILVLPTVFLRFLAQIRRKTLGLFKTLLTP